MDGIASIIVLVFFWVIAAALRKATQQQQKKVTRPAAQQPAKEEQPAVQSKPAERLTTLTPSISLTGHDDSVYQGSLNAVTGEGYDPCHDEQLSVMPSAGDAAPAPQPVSAQPSLPFGWTGSDMVRGIVMSEILKRK